MQCAVGLWIDHRKAVIVAVTDLGKGKATSPIVSTVENREGRFAGGSSGTPYESIQVPADDRQLTQDNQHLATYFDAVITSLRGAESILILGPGEAKGELKRRLEKDNLGGRIVGIETGDKMTDRQITARVSQHFSRKLRAGTPARA